jgi:hypothetical protein
MKKLKLIIVALIGFLSILLNIYQMNENNTTKIDTVHAGIDSVHAGVDTIHAGVDTMNTVFDIVSDVTN